MKYKAGQVIDDRYKVLEVIGQGGHGIVYRALDQLLSAEVALKCLHDDVANEPGLKTRTLREARAMGALSGTSAVQVLDFSRADGAGMYIAMELLQGKELEAHLKEIEADGGRIPFAELEELMAPIVDTLEAAHQRSIIHRDLKPANIFALSSSARGRVRLLDFGLAKDMKADPLTMDGMIAGSPSYIAPEVWRAKPDLIDHRIDVYSLGAVIYRALAGQTPFDKKQPIDKLLIAVTRGPRPSLHAIRPDLPATIDDWVQKALAISPDDRFTSVRTLWTVLHSIAGTASRRG